MKMETEHQAVIIGNGDFPTSPFALKVLNEATYVVCCDGGANEYIRKGYVPDAIVGDGDSLADDIKQQHKEIIHYYPCQETNDQTKAVNFLIEKGFKNITIIGATGKREDHTLGILRSFLSTVDTVTTVKSIINTVTAIKIQVATFNEILSIFLTVLFIKITP